MSAGLHICRSPNIATERFVFRCAACRRRRRHVCTFQGYYGSHVVCCACGLTADSGYRMRLTKRQRAVAASKARAAWTTAVTRAEAHRLIRAWFEQGVEVA